MTELSFTGDMGAAAASQAPNYKTSLSGAAWSSRYSYK
jgi:hypothetical protein